MPREEAIRLVCENVKKEWSGAPYEVVLDRLRGSLMEQLYDWDMPSDADIQDCARKISKGQA